MRDENLPSHCKQSRFNSNGGSEIPFSTFNFVLKGLSWNMGLGISLSVISGGVYSSPMRVIELIILPRLFQVARYLNLCRTVPAVTR